MLNDIFLNIVLLMAFTFLGGHLLREFPENFREKAYGKIILGIGGGVLGILMIIYTIHVGSTNTMLDLRVLSLMMISRVGGLIPSIITGFIILLYRVGVAGITESSIFAIIHVFLYITTFHLINKKVKDEWKNWFLKLAVSLVILDSTLPFLLRDMKNSFSIAVGFSLVIFFAGAVEFFLLRYTIHSNEMYRRYQKDSTSDFLTGLNNSRNFDKLLAMSFEQAIEKNEQLSCLMIDIDHFKRVNDTYGHAAGDIILQELADILNKNCRTFDIIGRVGGEEFCALLLDCPSNRAYEIAATIRNAVKNHRFAIGENKFIGITVSIGAATYPDTVINLDDLIKKADMALYRAKQTGRDKVCNNLNCNVG